MIQVFPNLYVGDDEDGTKARESGQFFVCSCCKDGPNGHRSVLGYKTPGAPKGKEYIVAKDGPRHVALNLVDADDPNYISDEAVNYALKFIADHIDKGKVLVHCNKGHSRSPSIAMLYLRSIGELPERFRDGFKIFKALYDKYDPGQGMLQYTRTKYASLKNELEMEKIYGRKAKE